MKKNVLQFILFSYGILLSLGHPKRESRSYIQRQDFANGGHQRRTNLGRQPIGIYEKSFTRKYENETQIIIPGLRMSSERPRGGDSDNNRRHLNLFIKWRQRSLPVGNGLPQKEMPYPDQNDRVPIKLPMILLPRQMSAMMIESTTSTMIPIKNPNDRKSLQHHTLESVEGGQYVQYTETQGPSRKSSNILQRYVVVLIVALTRTTTRLIHTIGKDWYTGYYLRTTLERVEHQYKKRYDVPACLRSVGRLVIHSLILVLLGEIMEWMVGLTHLPCSYSSGGCHWWCGLLWLVAVTGPGHAAGVAMAIWVRGLRLQLAAEYSSQQRPSVRRIISRPGTLIRWILDPDQWFREIMAAATRDSTADPVRYALQPFDPDWRMFPATWSTLRVVQMIAIAKEMHGSDRIMHTFMRLVLFQQAFSDEWYRVLMCEKRVAWGIVVMVGYSISTIGLFWNMIRKPAHIVSSLSILMTTPSVLAVVISFWMNILVYFERRQNQIATTKDNKLVMIDPIQSAIQQYQKANIIPLLSRG